MNSKFQDRYYTNWIKCTLGLIKTKESLQRHAQSRFCEFQGQLKSYFDDEQPHLCPKPYHLKCKWSTPKQNSRTRKWKMDDTNCLKNKLIFEKLLEKCVDRNSKHIGWKNSSSLQNIPDSPAWEIAKVFMPRGNQYSHEPTLTDAAAIFNILNVCVLFEPIDHDLLDKLMDIRNRIMHSANNRVCRTDMNEYLDCMVGFLKIMNEKCGLLECLNASSEIEKLKCTELTMTFEQEEKALLYKRDAIVRDLSTDHNNHLSHLRAALRQCDAAIIKANLEQTTHKLNTLHTGQMEDMKRQNEDLQRQNEDLQLQNEDLQLQNEELQRQNETLQRENENTEQNQTRRLTDLLDYVQNVKDDFNDPECIHKELFASVMTQIMDSLKGAGAIENPRVEERDTPLVRHPQRSAQSECTLS